MGIDEPKVASLQKEYYEIQERYANVPLTIVLLEQCRMEIAMLFNRYDLDLWFTINLEGNTIVITPIRNIDQLAMLGLLLFKKLN